MKTIVHSTACIMALKETETSSGIKDKEALFNVTYLKQIT